MLPEENEWVLTQPGSSLTDLIEMHNFLGHLTWTKACSCLFVCLSVFHNPTAFQNH